MAREHINIGTPNGQNGDFVRDAFDKTNLNFIEVYDLLDNEVRIITIPEDEITSFDEQGISEWINLNGINVTEVENIIFEIGESSGGINPDEPEPLDDTIPLVLNWSNITQTSVQLDWDPSTDTALVSYKLFYINDATGETVQIDKEDSISHLLTGLSSGTKYRVYIEGYDSLFNIKTSNIAFIKTDFFVPISSKAVIQTNGITETTVDLEWFIDAAFGADRYEVYQVGVGKIYDGINTTLQVTGLTGSTSYTFYVIAFNGVTPSTQSDDLIITTVDAVSPTLTPPIISTIGVETDSITISISSDALEYDRIDGYVVEYKIKGSSLDWTLIAINRLSSYALTNLLLNTNYLIRVKAVDDDVAIESGYSNVLDLYTLNEVGVKLDLEKLPFIISQQDIDDGYIGQVKLTEGLPNTVVSLSSAFNIEYRGASLPASTVSILFKDLSLPGLENDNVAALYIQLDNNGEAYKVFKFVGADEGSKIRLTMNIISARGGLNPDFSTDSELYNL